MAKCTERRESEFFNNLKSSDKNLNPFPGLDPSKEEMRDPTVKGAFVWIIRKD